MRINKAIQISAVALSACIFGGLLLVAVQSSGVRTVILAAGSPGGESYILATALKTVVERHNPQVRLNILETGGTVESLRFLEEGRAQLATAQADVMPGRSAQMVAVLYDDVFQLLAHTGSKMESFPDLRGKRIAVPQTGGQFQSFLRVADHFGLRETDFRFVGSNDSSADEAFLRAHADAIFRVRALGNPTIQRLVESGKVRFMRIEQAAAMKIRQPAFQPAVIPKGAYMGNPPVPPEDLPTVAVERTLLARSSADPSAIRAITSVLLERRQEVMTEIPASMPEVRLLLAGVRKPEQQAGLAPILHAGAESFFNKDKPSFLLAHADYVGLLVSVALMIGSWVWELKQWIQHQQKNKADAYSKKVLDLMAESQQTGSAAKLDEIRSELLGVLAAAFADLDADKLSEESFHSFCAILQIALDVVKEKRLSSALSPMRAIVS